MTPPLAAHRRFPIGLVVALLTTAAAGAQDVAGGRFPDRRPSGAEERRGEGGRGGEGGGEGGRQDSGAGAGPGGAEGQPAPFEALVEPFNLARYHERFDEARGRDTRRSDKPRAPEIPLATFFESIRPLGGLKYENQLSYLAAGYTGDAPTFQTLTYEYVFADWNSARVQVIAPNNRVSALGFGYQRTFRVGPRGNWVDGALIQVETATTGSGFVGGSAFYTFAWKPDKESAWTVTLTAGANRASFANRPLSGGGSGAAEGGVGSLMMAQPGLGGQSDRPPPGSRAEEEARIWRPIANLNLFYTLSPTWTLGTEVDTFAHDRFGEYLVLPNVTYRPTKHFFVQLGAGYYQIGGNGQATFQCRVNLLNPSPRVARED